jgi:hypothetical protein
MSLDGATTPREWFVFPSVFQTNDFEACARIERELKVPLP